MKCLILLTLTLLFPMHAHGQATPEVRGTWLTTTANTAIRTREDTQATMKRLRDIGLNTVYVECWKNGYTEFPSQVMKKTTGVEMKINASVKGTPAVQRDLLGECVIQAHRNQLLCIAWFEYGFMAAHKDTKNELRARKDWLSLDKDGNEVAKNGFVWLNPIHPDAQELLIGIVVEAVKTYDLDGVQLDDRIVWPYIDMGYDNYTKKTYKQETGRDVPDDPKEKQWFDWRVKKVTEFSKRFVREVKAANPNIIVSLSPGPYPWAYDNYLCDWKNWAKWTDNPTWDEYIPQVYRMNFETFERDWREQVKYMDESHRVKDLVAGIRLVGDGPDLPKDDVIKSADATRTPQSGGHCWWFSRGVLDIYSDLLTDYYDVKSKGQAPHPKKGVDWRPAPIVGQGVQDFTFDVPADGKYRVIRQSHDGEWEEIDTRQLKKGVFKLHITDAARVELLVDRREG
jgi:uncharacterized lipoprotein YddW (UPF0748 family)